MLPVFLSPAHRLTGTSPTEALQLRDVWFPVWPPASEPSQCFCRTEIRTVLCSLLEPHVCLVLLPCCMIHFLFSFTSQIVCLSVRAAGHSWVFVVLCVVVYRLSCLRSVVEGTGSNIRTVSEDKRRQCLWASVCFTVCVSQCVCLTCLTVCVFNVWLWRRAKFQWLMF